ncbi:hypothetical protein LSH36_932g01012 [Paralvinella palmiformis]|uniref:Uncharacterized protein n=1 Tax=Paralvinella palmiformis TaxID=53620 RepID=A0AAD9IY23_9ANNE|nr:hypothetical protein LSH36_932g01012 [Paralvinella palmiformis]
MNIHAVWKRGKITVIISLLQVTIIILFGIFVDYAPDADASVKANSIDMDKGGADTRNTDIVKTYPSKTLAILPTSITDTYLMTC